MFDDMTLEQLKALRSTLRQKLEDLIFGEKTIEFRYGDHGEKLGTADIKQARIYIAEISQRIATLEGGRRGGFTIMHGA